MTFFVFALLISALTVVAERLGGAVGKFVLAAAVLTTYGIVRWRRQISKNQNEQNGKWDKHI